ncbi:MAG: hypothetical protein EBU90_18980 [Proteobacteria bacterium]|nr:hypothetical protein [Pseudomonadota bacterium]NBP15500.1 hypothetical protein [bacterium]
MLTLAVQPKQILKRSGERRGGKPINSTQLLANLLKGFAMAEKLKRISRNIATNNRIYINTKTNSFSIEVLNVRITGFACHQASQLGQSVGVCFIVHTNSIMEI